MNALLRVGGTDLEVDLSSPVSLGLELDFAAPQPRHFGAPPATSRPYAVPGFSGAVASGASCNCAVVTLVPHCNGTHTESAGHLTLEPLDAHRVAPAGLVPALLVTVTLVMADATHETSDPAPHSGDRLVTRSAIESRWPQALPFDVQALVVRTGSALGPSSPYLTREAARLLVERGIQHLVIDLPSIDREHDEGRLCAHRLFFGLPPGVSSLVQASRPGATVTELAHIPGALADGPYLLQLQMPAWRGDAVPSRPLLYAVRECMSHGSRLSSPMKP